NEPVHAPRETSRLGVATDELRAGRKGNASHLTLEPAPPHQVRQADAGNEAERVRRAAAESVRLGLPKAEYEPADHSEQENRLEVLTRTANESPVDVRQPNEQTIGESREAPATHRVTGSSARQA